MLNYMEFSRSALLRNGRTIIEYVGCPVIGVVKCGGYGLSPVEAARVWLEAGASFLAVSRPEEALTLRRAGIDCDILLTAPAADADTVKRLAEANVILTVTGWENAIFYAKTRGISAVRVHIAVDTGMGRFGLRWTEAEKIKAIYTVDRLAVEGIFSHFARSFEPDFSAVSQQLYRFTALTDRLAADGVTVGLRHIANTNAALRFPQTRLDAVRIGGGLLGIAAEPCPVPLTRTGVMKAQVVDIKLFEVGDTTGYASICKITKPTRAAVVSVGYEDGIGYMRYPDHFSLRYLAGDLKQVMGAYFHPLSARFRGRELPLIGRVGSQYTLFDAADVKIAPGDYVELDADVLFPRQRRVILPDKNGSR